MTSSQYYKAKAISQRLRAKLARIAHFEYFPVLRDARLRTIFYYLISLKIRNSLKFGSFRFKTRDALIPSVLLIGYIDGQLGLGQSLRGLSSALAESGTTFFIYPFGVGIEGRRSGNFMSERYDERRPHPINIIEIATNQLPTLHASMPDSYFGNSYNILRTYWELSDTPAEWREYLHRIDEIWAPSSFVATSLRSMFSGPINIIPPCVEFPEFQKLGHRHFGLDEARFYFLFSFDYFSSPNRKNPMAVVRAFQRAFADKGLPVGLIIKSVNAHADTGPTRDELRQAAASDPRIIDIEEYFERGTMLALLDLADCYVSLHRSEGFGFGMAEAMRMGKPVIGTNYSGCTDFLDDRTGYPVPFDLKSLEPDDYIHAERQVWADPSEDHCSTVMLDMFRSRLESKLKGRLARQFIIKEYGADRVGALANRRLREIAADLPAAGEPTAVR